MIRTILKHKISALILAALISAAGFYGCGDSVSPPQSDNVSFSVMSSTDSIGDSQNILILDTVKILIKDIKVKVANEDSANFKVGSICSVPKLVFKHKYHKYCNSSCRHL